MRCSLPTRRGCTWSSQSCPYEAILLRAIPVPFIGDSAYRIRAGSLLYLAPGFAHQTRPFWLCLPNALSNFKKRPPSNHIVSMKGTGLMKDALTEKLVLGENAVQRAILPTFPPHTRWAASFGLKIHVSERLISFKHGVVFPVRIPNHNISRGKSPSSSGQPISNTECYGSH